ncbi:MAG: HAMP domain-containing histidine kinase, partial [Methanoregula sp.]|nr:HAMP domain-containing histidine kinase [Methanoregula sp.]
IIDVELSTNAAVFSGEKLIFCVVRDTSERKKAEAQLKRFNEDLQSEVKSRMKAESELVRKNEDLHAACGQLAATEEDLRENYQVLKKSEQALMQARKKLNLLNTLTFQDIQNGIFSLAGFIQLAKGAGCSDDAVVLLKKGEDILRSVRTSLDFAKKFQNLGISQPRWHDVNYTLVNAISHLDFSAISRTVDLGSLEIYADPLLEDVFLTLMENVIVHGAGATEVRISSRKDTDRITILVEDNGPGIPAARKEEIFAREYKGTSGTSLFFAREILSITDITLRETGEPGKGSRFEITVPEGKYRFSGSGG